MQELGKSDIKTNIIANGLEQFMIFNINDKLTSIDSFRFLSASIDILVKDLRKDDFKYLSQQFHSKIHLVKEKGFYYYEHMSNL